MNTGISKEKLNELRDTFNFYDKDNSGCLNLNDMREVMKIVQKDREFDDDEIIDMINEVDADGNGTIEFDEFLAIFEKQNKRGAEENYREVFEKFDLDGNGRLSISEMKHGLKNFGTKLNDDEIDVILDVINIDDNGEIEYEEFIDFMVNK